MSVLHSKKISNLTYAIEVEDFMVTTDVAKNLGGNNLAPDPHRYLEIALAGCTVITIEMYAKRKKMALDSVDVQIIITEEGETNRILREINLSGNLSAEERSSLMSIAERCPVHKFITRGAEIETKEIK